MKKSNKKYVLMLILLWIVGCLLQFLFCCSSKTSSQKALVGAGVAATAVVAGDAALDQIPQATNHGFSLVDDQFNLKGEHGFDFEKSSVDPLVPYSADLNANIKKTVQYLKNHPERQLVVVGRYHADEENNTDFDNLGLARADIIKNQFIVAGVNPQQLVTKGEIYSDAVANAQGQYLGMIDFGMQDTPEATNNGFGLNADGLMLKGDHGFDFAQGDAMPLSPYAEELNANVSKMVEYLKANPARQLTVTGRYRADEVNNTPFPNLGLARAEQIKKQLMALGIDSKQIEIEGKLYPEAISNHKGQFLGMADFSVKELNDAGLTERQQKMDDLLADLTANPLTLYFDTGHSKLTFSEVQRNRVLSIVTYLDYEPSAKVVMTGHTDNVGKAEDNLRLGKKRALFAADYFAKNGLSKEQMMAVSKGSSEPIADNATEEGRAKNRRVTITIFKDSK